MIIEKLKKGLTASVRRQSGVYIFKPHKGT